MNLKKEQVIFLLCYVSGYLGGPVYIELVSLSLEAGGLGGKRRLCLFIPSKVGRKYFTFISSMLKYRYKSKIENATTQV